MGEMPFMLTYGYETMVPLDNGAGSFRSEHLGYVHLVGME